MYMKQLFTVSTGTGSNYYRHVLIAVLKELNNFELAKVSCPSEQEREEMNGLINRFPQCVEFIDKATLRRWRPIDKV